MRIIGLAGFVIIPFVVLYAWKWVDKQSAVMNDDEFDMHYYDLIMVKEFIILIGLMGMFLSIYLIW